MSALSEGKIESEGFVFRLFVAGDEVHSKTARENLSRICEHLDNRCEIEVVDVFTSFEKALENGVFLTPALIKVLPRPRTTIFGNLSNIAEVLKALHSETQ